MFPIFGIKQIKESYLKQHPGGLTSDEFDLLAENLFNECKKLMLKGKKVQFATRYGYLCIRSRDGSRPRIVNGKPVKGINYNATLKLWMEDKQAYLEQRKIYSDWTFVNSARWIKGNNVLPNKRLYQYNANAKLASEIRQLSLKGKIFERR